MMPSFMQSQWWPFGWESRGFWVYRWLTWVWYAKVLRNPNVVCRPDCALCEVQCRINNHFEACAECQGEGYPCAAMVPLREEEDRVTVQLFPWTADTVSPYATNGTASSVPVVVFPPWDWRKP